MNAPLHHPVTPAAERQETAPAERYPRFPKLTPAELEARKAAARAFMAPLVAELGRPRPFIDFGLQYRTHPVGLEWGTAREARNVLR